MDIPAMLGRAVAEFGARVEQIGSDVAGYTPGDVVFGAPEGVYFIPPSQVQSLVDEADVTHIHDEWTKKKFDEGKYKSSEIYGSPSDPKLQQEYKDYLKKRLDEIHKQRSSK